MRGGGSGWLGEGGRERVVGGGEGGSRWLGMGREGAGG